MSEFRNLEGYEEQIGRFVFLLLVFGEYVVYVIYRAIASHGKAEAVSVVRVTESVNVIIFERIIHSYPAFTQIEAEEQL